MIRSGLFPRDQPLDQVRKPIGGGHLDHPSVDEVGRSRVHTDPVPEGELQVDFDVPEALARDGEQGPQKEFTIGGGGAQVKIQTFDGPVAIRRR